MALAQVLSAPSNPVAVDSRPMTCGWHDAHNSAHEQFPWDSFGEGPGTASAAQCAVATVSTSAILFRVEQRDTAGLVATVQTGELAASATQGATADLALFPASFPLVAGAVYRVVPAGNLVPSVTVPNGFVWDTAPLDGGGFTCTLVAFMS